jgi:DNA mismatch repair protein MutS
MTCWKPLTVEGVKSHGFIALRNYLRGYVQTDRFITLGDETKKIKKDLSKITYSLLVKGSNIKVSFYESEIDYSEEIINTFEKFKQGAVKDFRVEFKESPFMNHVEAQILDMVAKLFPEIFKELDQFCLRNSDYLDEVIEVFDREIQFYISYLEFMDIFKQSGLFFCYPKIATKTKDIYNTNGFDLALAKKHHDEKKPVVCNDFYLKDAERIIIVSGPNQGGKTTFARTFGQLHYLASIGCPVPGRKARLFLFDNIFTHFEKEENAISLKGKLEDDLLRIKTVINQATSNSIIIMNEIFNSTTLKDAIILSKNVIEKIIDLDILTVCVTFVDELASLSEKTVSMVSTVDPENPDNRTYKIIRKPADGLAYAIYIAERHQLTYDQLKGRIKS